MPKLIIPQILTPYTNGQTQLDISINSTKDFIGVIKSTLPKLHDVIVTKDGALNGFVNIYLGENTLSQLLNTDTKINNDDVLEIITSVSGG